VETERDVKAGRLYEVTVQLRIEPGPTFEELKISVRAYDANDAMYSALIKLNDPRVDKITNIEPLADDANRVLFDLERLLGPDLKRGGA
jgi:hypothetical protein